MNATDTDLVERLTALVHEAQQERARTLLALRGCSDAERDTHEPAMRRLREIDSLGRGLIFWLEHDQ